MAQRLYVSDLDGTLLDRSGEVSERTRTGLRALLDAGMQFSVASARSYFSIRKLFGDLELKLPIIEFNGAFLTDYATGRHLEINSLGQALGEELFDRIAHAGQRPFVCSFNGEEDCLHYDELINPGMVWYEGRRRSAGDTRLRRTLDLRSTMAEDVVSLTVMDQDEAGIVALRDQLAHSYGDSLQLYCYENEYSKGTFWLTVHHERASKHIAMQSLRDRWARGAELVVFGDNHNDVAMLTHADRAIAVENAVPELLSRAHEVIGHHGDDSVIRYIEADFAR
ncbi:MAG TPA: HAD family hydrolase [Polyangiaceae bacterium]|nr:HAD family hydrolase [Polyangiaceae bacterium]